jgi:hypothetical protein
MWFGQEGRHGVCRVVFSCCVFQIMTPNAYVFMYAFHRQFNHDQLNTFSNLRRKSKKKKDNKKLVKHLKF